MCCLPWNALYIASGCSRIPSQKYVDMSLDVSTFDKNVSKLCHQSQVCRYRSITPGVRNSYSPLPIYTMLTQCDGNFQNYCVEVLSVAYRFMTKSYYAAQFGFCNPVRNRSTAKGWEIWGSIPRVRKEVSSRQNPYREPLGQTQPPTVGT